MSLARNRRLEHYIFQWVQPLKLMGSLSYNVTDSIGIMDFDPNDPTSDFPREAIPKYHNQE